MANSEISKCLSCGQEMHPTDYVAILRAQVERLTKERNEAICHFNEIDLCKMGQAPCEYAMKLIAENDALESRVALAAGLALEKIKEKLCSNCLKKF